MSHISKQFCFLNLLWLPSVTIIQCNVLEAFEMPRTSKHLSQAYHTFKVEVFSVVVTMESLLVDL